MKLLPSSRAGKKWSVIYDQKTIHFGDSNYEDYTQHKDPLRKASYRKRHIHDSIADPSKPGFWSWHVLWNKPSIQQSFDEAVRLAMQK